MTDQSCKTCGGSGFFYYDENHAMICQNCCNHTNGFWEVSKIYHPSKHIEGGDNGCCRQCGMMRRDIKQEVTQ
jgi:hypothetical protein